MASNLCIQKTCIFEQGMSFVSPTLVLNPKNNSYNWGHMVSDGLIGICTRVSPHSLSSKLVETWDQRSNILSSLLCVRVRCLRCPQWERFPKWYSRWVVVDDVNLHFAEWSECFEQIFLQRTYIRCLQMIDRHRREHLKQLRFVSEKAKRPLPSIDHVIPSRDKVMHSWGVSACGGSAQKGVVVGGVVLHGDHTDVTP